MQIVLSLKFKFSRCDFKQVSRSKNNQIDSLANLASAVEYQFPTEYIMKPSIQRSRGEVLFLDTSSGWRDLIIAYLRDRVLPGDKIKMQKFQHMASRYILLGDILYKKSYFKLHSDTYLKSLGLDKAKKVMQKIHDGDYRNHERGRSLATKPLIGVLLAQDVQRCQGVRRCPQCQRFAPSSSRPSKGLHALWSPWPFIQ